MLFNTMAEELNFRKECVIMALRGKVLLGISHGEGVFEPASPEECEKAILEAFDFAAVNLIREMASGRAMDRLLERHNMDWKKFFFDYMSYYDEELLKSEKLYPYYSEDDFEDDEEGE